ncbi:HET-domain-containing protein [Apiospora arundinis]
MHPELKALMNLKIGRSRDWGEYIELDSLNHWIRYCDKNHGDTCGYPSTDRRSLEFRLSWLIDVEQWCLVPAPEDARYVALSYVWGQTPMLKTLEGNLMDQQKPGALRSKSNETMHVPATIRNAISLTSQLEGGIKYLWVDSLCIVQDDKNSLDRHIQNMGLIYEAAVLTIIAAIGTHADQELQGLEGISSPRPVAPFMEYDDHFQIRALFNSEVRHSHWAGRGWTFQEGMFSRRKLIFFEDTVRWVCQGMTAREETTDDHPSSSDMMIRSARFSYPDLGALVELIGEFNRRDLTFPEDILSAISGTLNALAPAYPAGFVFGLPISFFDCFLLWASRTGGKGRRREAVSPSRSQDVPPSWSWAGWEGLDADIRGCTFSANMDFSYSTGIETIPMLDWSLRDSVTSPPVRIPRQNDWYEFRRQYMGKMDGLPLGWHCELDTDTHSLYYRHDYVIPMPGEGNVVRFCQPVPIASGIGDQIAPGSEVGASYGRYLCAKARSAKLWLEPRQPRPGIDPLDESEFAISDGSRVPIGRLLVDEAYHHGLVMSRLLGPETNGDGSRFPCEIIAISRCVSLWGRNSPFPPGEEVFTEYNVLWIEWEGSVAFRRGMGRVSVDAWDSLEFKEIDLILG